MSYIFPWPKGTPISQEFGANPGGVNPVGGHTGLDGALPEGTPLRAPADGVVELEGWFGNSDGSDNAYWLTDGGGIKLVLNCGPGRPSFILAHLSETLVDVGQYVKQGDIIAKSGNTGKWTTGPHCHFEYLRDGFNLRDNTYGRSNPREVVDTYWEDLQQFGSIQLSGSITHIAESSLGFALRTVTNDVAMVRVGPYSGATPAPGYEEGIEKGSNLAVIGYVKGEDPYGNGDDAWYKTKSGYFVWANAAENNIEGLTYLGEVAVPAKPIPAQLPAPTPVTPAPTPVPAPEPTPVVVTPLYDFTRDFLTINGITVEKIPAHWDNYGEDFPENPEKAVCHWWNSLEKRPSLESVIGEFCYRSTQKSPHFIVTDDRIIQVVSLSDRAFHAKAAGNGWVGIEIDPRAIEKNADGTYTARALKIQANVRGLLEALKVKFGYKLSLTLHKDVPGAATDCSDLVLADFDIPDVGEPAPVDDMDPTTIRKLISWLTGLLASKEK